jgi:tetratricopeptide (TPR) repeat protein
MPLRSRSHQLEDISVNRFSDLLPSAWVVRRKDKDYGSDLEIEIFEESGAATGLAFLVQLRATDNRGKARKLSLAVDQLEYFLSLRLPTVVVRYCDTDQSLYWQWHFNIAGSMPLKRNQKSFTYVFDDGESWSQESATLIKKSLETRRIIEGYSPVSRVGLRYDCSPLEISDRYVCESALNDLLTLVPDTFMLGSGGGTALELNVTAQSDVLKVSIDCLGSISVEMNGYDRDDVLTSLLYYVAALLARHRLTAQAHRVAQVVLARGKPHFSRFIAFEVCNALAADLNRSVSLALLNGLHNYHDNFYARYMAVLFRSPQDAADRESAIERFFCAAVDGARKVAPGTEATVQCSLGHFYRGQGRMARAMRHFNIARKLRPAYSEMGYFLQALGACLFESAHYRCAAEVYAQGLAIEQGPLQQLHLGDALLFAGRIGEAAGKYDAILADDNTLRRIEALLKLELCKWLTRWVDGSVGPTRRTEALRMIEAAEEHDADICRDIISTVDVVNEIAHARLGLARAQQGEFDGAFGHYLLCAFKQSANVDAWANAILCAYNLRDWEVIMAVISSALSLCGRQWYDRLRDLLVQQSAPEVLLGALDQACQELSDEIVKSRRGHLILRAHWPDHYDVLRLS